MPRAFRLIETLGEGSFGAVHLAEVAGGEGFVQRLAVKWLLPQWSHDNELVGRLRDEARLLALLNHDHVVRVHGLTRIDGRLAILMEAVDGVDLSRQEGPIPPRAAVQIVDAVADALDAAWCTIPPGGTEPLNVVHRDIKPSNVMVTNRGGVKVMDFGVARATFDAREARTRSQQFGTARYMAPERWLHGVSDAPSDVFSLGITLIELVGGVPVERPRLAEEGFREDLDHALLPLAPWPEIHEIAKAMCAFRPEDRPTARGVADRCAAITDLLPAPGLKEWSPSFVANRPARRGSADGSIVHEDTNETFVSGMTEPYSVGLAPTTSAPIPGRAPTPTIPLPVQIVPVPKAADSDAPRWRQAMLALAIAAATVLAVTTWQAWRGTVAASTRAAVEVPATPVAPAPEPPPVVVPVVEPPPVVAVVAPAAPDPVVIKPVVEKKKPEPAPVEVVPDPVVVVDDPVADAVDNVIVTFQFDPNLEVTADPGGAVTSRRGMSFRRNALINVRVHGDDVDFPCTIPTGDGSTVIIDGREHTCR